MCKKFVFLFAVFVVNTFNAFCADDEDKLLNEIVSEELAESGICKHFSFNGKLDLTTLFIKQDIDGDDSAVESLQGSVNMKCLNKCEDCGYGLELGIKTHSGIIKRGSPIVRTSCLFLEADKVGIIRVGYTGTAACEFAISGSTFLVGYEGPGSGNFGLFFNEATGSIIDTGFIYDDSKARKISWFSPVVSGFSTGLSFTPDSRKATLFKTYRKKPRTSEIDEEKANFPGMRTSYAKNIVTGGLAYEFGAPDSLNSKIAISIWHGNGKSGVEGKKVRSVMAYNIGAIVCYKDFKVSLGYMNNGRSLLSKKYASANITTFDSEKRYTFNNPEIGIKEGANTGKIYSIGAAYSFGKLDVSAGYFKSIVKFSRSEKSKADIISVSTECKFNRALGVYAEYDHLSTKTCARAQAYTVACHKSAVGNNKANIFMIGTKINF